jgi:hypothetical protein
MRALISIHLFSKLFVGRIYGNREIEGYESYPVVTHVCTEDSAAREIERANRADNDYLQKQPRHGIMKADVRIEGILQYLRRSGEMFRILTYEVC